MPSPFPGTDPYLEGYLWADVHQALAYQFRRQLVPLVAPKYAVRLAVTMVTDRVPAHEIGIVFPDVEIIRSHRPTEPAVVPTPAAVAIPPAPVSMPLDMLVPTRLVTVEVRDTAQNALVRAGHLQAELWPIALRDPLPLLPVPLHSPDPDVPLHVQQALEAIYDEAQHGLTLDYDGPPPPPPLSSQDMAWVESRVRSWRQEAKRDVPDHLRYLGWSPWLLRPSQLFRSGCGAENSGWRTRR